MDDKDIRRSASEAENAASETGADVPDQIEKGTYTEDAVNASSLDVQGYEIPESESRYFEGEVDEVPPIDIPDEELYAMDYGSLEGGGDGSKPRKKRRRKNYLLRIGIVILVVVFAIVFMKSEYFMVKKISIEGNNNYSDSYILKKTEIKKGMNIIFDVDASDGEEALLSNPYFAEASIERDLPDKVNIRVQERKNAAKVRVNNRYYIIDKDGIVLRKTKRLLKVTLLMGVKAAKTQRGEVIAAKDSKNQKLLDSNLKLLEIIREGDLYFKKIDLTDKILKLYVKNKLYVKGEWDDIIHTIENGNLRKVIYDLKKNHVEKGTITVLKNDYISFGKKLR